ncbi:hypothetical protein VB735_18155 [Halotia wernerae UHCC 0503]|nr:hypothetical protein [Halotia wernerae UHCC 0503]
MKSTQRPSKPPKQQPKNNEPNPKPEFITDQPVEEPQEVSQPTPSNEPQAAISQQKNDFQKQPKPQLGESQQRSEHFQHIQFLDCDKPVGRIIFECYHCQQGILSEFTGEPVMGEYKGHPSAIQVKIQCPNCEQTAIRLTTGKVLSTTAIPSPWQQ